MFTIKNALCNRNPLKVANYILRRISPLFKNDEFYLKLDYYTSMGKKLNLNNPTTFTEKLQWLKLHDKHEEYSQLVDKYLVKNYVADKIGEEYIIPSLGVWDRFEDIDFDKLPNQFVLKCTHDSGGVILCKDKSKLDIVATRKKINKSLKRNFYWWHREYPYKTVKPRILAEKYMVDESQTELKDYKLFCFNGEVQFLKVDFNRETYHQANYLTPEWTLLPFGEKIYPPDFNRVLNKPANFEEMLQLAKQLAKDIPFARIDFYSINGRTKFGEITFFPAGGMGAFVPEEADLKIGKLLTLPNGGGI